MSDKLYAVPAEWKARAHVKEPDYRAMYQRSLVLVRYYAMAPGRATRLAILPLWSAARVREL